MSKLSQSLLLRPHKQQRRGSATSNMKSCYASSEAASDDQSYQVPAPQQNEFAADEPLPSTSPTQATTGSHKVTIKTHTETTAIPAADSCPQYPALVSICAPPLEDPDGEGRTPIDLVTVLDVSGSMQGQKLELVKQAVKFVIENLGSSDRLSIVSFSSTARTEFPLRRMSADGREDAIRAVNSLRTEGMTNIAAGLKIGAQILKGRREKNPVASIILLSDGHDNCSSEAEMLNNLPSSIPSSNNIKEEIPVHTFGFGNDHDPKTMHAISDASGGTFSYIESVGMIQDGFALCIGGLLSVVAQEVRLTVKSASSGVKIVSIPSGRHVNEVSDEGQQGVVHVGNMYAEEVKLFLVYLTVPPSSASDSKTPLLDVSCAYKDPASDELIQVQGERVEISRPQFCSPAEVAVSLEVDRQRNRLLVADAIGEAQRLAEMGNLEGARKVLTHRRKTLLASAAALGGDSLSKLLETELREVRDRMESREMYEYVGRAYACAGMSSHSLQRASARGNARGSCLAAGLKLAAKTGCFVYSRGRSAGAHGGGGRGGGGRGSRGGLGSRGSFGASGRGFRGRGAAGRGASRSMLFNDASLHGDEDEAEDCEADHLVGAFETPAMIRMVQKSQKRNRST